MALDTQEEIEQYLLLERKTNDELRVICEGMELPTEGERKDLIARLVTLNIQPQFDFMRPQMIALRTKIHGLEIAGAEAFMKLVRKTIFDGSTNRKEFSVLNEKGNSYLMAMKYAKCSLSTFKMLAEKDMIYPHQSQRELVRVLVKDPTIFHLNLVQRAYGHNKTFIMLHSAPKAA